MSNCFNTVISHRKIILLHCKPVIIFFISFKRYLLYVIFKMPFLLDKCFSLHFKDLIILELEIVREES